MTKGLLMKQILVTLTLIVGLGTQVSADDKPFTVGDVFFCEMEMNALWGWDNKRLIKQKLERFKFSVISEDKIKFENSDYFSGKNTYYHLMHLGDLYLKAMRVSRPSGRLELLGKQFYHTTTHFAVPKIIFATCERF